MLDHALAAAARRHHGLLPTRVLRQLGITEHELKQRLQGGSLERLHETVVAIAGAPRTWERSAAAALAALPASALSHASGGRLHDYFGFANDPSVILSAALSAHHQLRGVRVRRTVCLPAAHLTVVDGLTVTTPARTLLDLAADLQDGRLQRVIEEALDHKRVTWDELSQVFGELAGRGRPGIGRMRRVLQRIEGLPPTESELERMYLRLLVDAGVPLPVTQVTAPWAEREPGRVDCMYVDARSIIELDGRTFHGRNSAFETDRYRDQLAELQGWSATRFTYNQVRRNSDHVIEVSRHLSVPHG